MALSESQWQAQVVELATLLGWRHFHVHDSRRSNPGWPDLVLIRDRVLFRELKTDSGRVRPEQQETLLALTVAGADVAVWRPRDLDEVMATLQRQAA